MPYKMFKNDKGKFCVKNSDTGESKGCSDSRATALGHMRALYAAEGGEKMGKKELEDSVNKGIEDYNIENPDDKITFIDAFDAFDFSEKELVKKGYAPNGVYSFGSLREYRAAQELVSSTIDLSYDFNSLVWNIMQSPEISDKPSAIKALADEFASILNEETSSDSEDKAISKIEPIVENILPSISTKERILNSINAFKETIIGFFTSETNDGGDLMVWKEIDTDQYRWFGRFSNNFRDEDKPPEIISEASHKYFIDRVEKGLAPMPELRIWHVPEWTIGQADWLAYDDAGNDAGFTLASGTFIKGLDDVAEWLLGQKKVLMSHGMPPWSIKYDSTDPSIIVQHESKEVSVLPDFAAANKLTGFAVLAMEEDMAIPKDKKDILINQWKADPAMLDRLEAMNVKVASLAKEAGLESKEQATKEETVENEDGVKVATETANTEGVVTQTTDTTVASATTATPTDFPTRQEIVEAVAAILTPMAERLDALETSIDGFTKAVKELQKDQDEQIKQTIDNTPAASLSALIMQRVVGNPDAELDGRKSLAKSKPQETPVNNRTIGVPFLDNMLSGSNH
jgi:hypothetical protein